MSTDIYSASNGETPMKAYLCDYQMKDRCFVVTNKLVSLPGDVNVIDMEDGQYLVDFRRDDIRTFAAFRIMGVDLASQIRAT